MKHATFSESHIPACGLLLKSIVLVVVMMALYEKHIIVVFGEQFLIRDDRQASQSTFLFCKRITDGEELSCKGTWRW